MREIVSAEAIGAPMNPRRMGVGPQTMKWIWVSFAKPKIKELRRTGLTEEVVREDVHWGCDADDASLDVEVTLGLEVPPASV